MKTKHDQEFAERRGIRVAALQQCACGGKCACSRGLLEQNYRSTEDPIVPFQSLELHCYHALLHNFCMLNSQFFAAVSSRSTSTLTLEGRPENTRPAGCRPVACVRAKDDGEDEFDPKFSTAANLPVQIFKNPGFSVPDPRVLH